MKQTVIFQVACYRNVTYGKSCLIDASILGPSQTFRVRDATIGRRKIFPSALPPTVFQGTFSMKPLQHRVATKNQQLAEHLHGWDERFDSDLADGDDGISIPEFDRPFRAGGDMES